MLWHPNPGNTMCTNDGNFPSDENIYESLVKCCKAVFGTLTCEYDDICSSPQPSKAPVTPQPSDVPTNSPVVTIITPEPSPSPTSCEERMLWHPNPGFKLCTNDGDYPANWVSEAMFDQYFHESLKECCKAVFGTTTCEYDDICATSPPSPSPTKTQETSPPSLAPVVTIITPAPSPAPSTCEERKWYAVSTNTEELCSNGYDIPAGWGGSEIYYDSLEECCQEEFSSNTCPFKDVCNTPIPTQAPQSPAPSPKPSPFPSVPIITPNPTEEKILTPQPSSPSPTTEAPVSPAPTISTPFPVVTIITPIPTEAPVTPRPSFFPTASPSFGSTPTVSKETTGPPTMMRGRTRSIPRGGNEHKKYSNTECDEVWGGKPEVCVYVCTEITSVYDGDVLIDERAKTSETEC